MNRQDASPECEHAIDAGAYLLSALPPAEHEAFSGHLRTCRPCRHEVQQLQIVVDTLPIAAPQLVPPPQLKDRIMRVVDAEAQLLRAAGPEGDRVVAQPQSRRARWWGSGLALRPVAAGALASVLLALGVAGGVLFGDNGPSTLPTKSLTAQVAAPGSKAVVTLQGERAALHVMNLPSAPAGQVYQVWIMRKGSTVPTPTHTLFNVRKDDGSAVVPIEESVRGVDQMLVTPEPDGGSLSPTGDTIISANLA